jgi:cephalosporin-C deacetylase-like acetyl esterase
VLNVARYYDAVNFARNIKCPAVIALGLVDRACPPTTVYSAYNVLTSSKTLVVAPMLGHDADKNPEYRRDARIKAKMPVRIRTTAGNRTIDRGQWFIPQSDP